jgi:hypothetical protein
MMDTTTDRNLVQIQDGLETQFARIAEVITLSRSTDELAKMQEFFAEATKLRYEQLNLQAEVMTLRKKIDNYLGE